MCIPRPIPAATPTPRRCLCQSCSPSARYPQCPVLPVPSIPSIPVPPGTRGYPGTAGRLRGRGRAGKEGKEGSGREGAGAAGSVPGDGWGEAAAELGCAATPLAINRGAGTEREERRGRQGSRPELSPDQLSSVQPSSATPGRTQVSASRAGSAERLRICARLRRSRQGQARSGRSTAPQSPVLWRALRGPLHIVIREDRAPQTPGLPRVSSGSCPQFGQKAKAPLGRRRALGAATPPHQGPSRRSPGTSIGKFLSLSSW